MTKISKALCDAALDLVRKLERLKFTSPITHVYNPLTYAWTAHEAYLERYAKSAKKVLYLGMNPGPWGMAQTGVPFGEVSAVRDWLKINVDIGKPCDEHPKRPIEGLLCKRSEVSGRRLWGLFQNHFETPHRFFATQFVCNYCPLVFMDIGGRNITPDKIKAAESVAMAAYCDEHLAIVIQTLKPEYLVGVGAFAEGCLIRAAKSSAISWQPRILRILHPSPASPAANRNWAGIVQETLEKAGIWQTIFAK